MPKNEEGEVLPVTNEAEFGYGVNYDTSPPSLIAAQVHAGKGIEATPKEDGLYGWNGEGALTPLQRYAEMLSGAGIRDANGTEWYFPERLTIDTGAVAEGNANPAQKVLDETRSSGTNCPTRSRSSRSTPNSTKPGRRPTLDAAETLADAVGDPEGEPDADRRGGNLRAQRPRGRVSEQRILQPWCRSSKACEPVTRPGPRAASQARLRRSAGAGVRR